MSRKRKDVSDKAVTRVVRIGTDSYERIKELRGKQTLIDFIDGAIDTIEMLSQCPPIFISGDVCYSDIKEARGQAIMQAAMEHKSELDLPYIAVILGQDTGE